MDGSSFDRLARDLGAGASRRRLLRGVSALPVVGGLASVLAEADAQRGKDKTDRNDNDADDHVAGAKKNRHKTNKRRRKKCRQKKARACDGGRCGTVTVRCKTGQGKKAKKRQIDCGPCVCDPPCDGGACCAQGTCVADCPAGQLCQADGACGVPECDVCETGCPFTSVQAAIDAADPGATITLCAGAYQEGEQILIDTSLTLLGAGDGEDPLVDTILDGQGQHRVVRVSFGTTVDLQGLRLTGGSTNESGGGLRIDDSEVTLTGCTVIDNAAVSDGGGIDNTGTLTLTDSSVSGNTANDTGGGIFNSINGTLTLTGSTVSGNTAVTQGGGIFNAGPLTLTNSTVRGNTAGDADGGIVNLADGTVSLAGTSQVCENTVDGQPSNCAGFTPPAGACTESCPA